jgi:hypothetical protein
MADLSRVHVERRVLTPLGPSQGPLLAHKPAAERMSDLGRPPMASFDPIADIRGHASRLRRPRSSGRTREVPVYAWRVRPPKPGRRARGRPSGPRPTT